MDKFWDRARIEYIMFELSVLNFDIINGCEGYPNNSIIEIYEYLEAIIDEKILV